MKTVNASDPLDLLYEPHLVIRKFLLSPGQEWLPKSSHWSLTHIGDGTGYWLEGSARTELPAGTVLLMAGDGAGRLLASRLNCLTLSAFTVMPDRLNGLITLGEQDFFKNASSRKELAFQVLSPQHPVAVKMNELCARENQGGLAFRLAMLQLLVEALGQELDRTAIPPEHANATKRLKEFLHKLPPEALLEINFEELAKITHCTARHLSRIFYDVMGRSYRDKRAEIRLGRARDLLATSKSKVVEVALESGFKSLSSFNLMFNRRFGISPGQWRKKHGGNGVKVNPTRKSRWPAVNRSRRRVI